MTHLKPIALAVAATFVATSAWAQQQQTQRVEKVEVTGTNIKRVDTEGPSPVQVISREDIERSGKATVSEILRTITASSGLSIDEKSTNSFAVGTSNVNLRGLGLSATLVLINGRRATNYSFAQNIGGISRGFVDLNSIPAGAIERIEILKDGASAIYGADAVAGVVNIILRRDYRGMDVSVRSGITGQGDTLEYSGTLSYGTGSLARDRYNIIATLDFFHRDETRYGDRDFSRDSNHTARGGNNFRTAFGNPGYYTQIPGTSPGFTGFRPFNNCPPANISGGRCLYNQNEMQTLYPETDRYALFTRGVIAFGQSMSGFVEASHNRGKSLSGVFGTPTIDAFQNGLIIPVGHPNNPFSTPVRVTTRFGEGDFGRRLSDLTVDNSRFLLGLKGALGNLDWEVASLWNRSKSKLYLRNYLTFNGIQSGIDDRTINFLNPAATPQSTWDRIRYTGLRQGDSETNLTDAKLSGELLQLPNGPLQFALGVEHGRYSVKDVPDPEIAAGNVLGTGSTSAAGSRRHTAGYIEFSAPILANLETQLAVRYDKYSDFGSSTNPKIGLKWAPTTKLALRGSWGTGFRAPSLFESYSGINIGFVSGVRDPLRCPITNANQDCNNPSVRSVSGGNPLLKPEESNQYVVGLIWDAAKDFSVSVDYYNIKQKNLISSLSVQTLVNNNVGVTRAAPTASDIALGIPGAIQQVSSQPFNFSSSKASGIDLDIRGAVSLDHFGKLLLNATASHFISFKTKQTPSSPEVENIGGYRLPRFKHVISATLQRAGWEFTLANNYTHSYSQPRPTTTYSRVSALTTWDLQTRYRGIKDWDLSLGALNIFNTKPPFSNQQEGFDPAFADPRGLFVYARARYSFR